MKIEEITKQMNEDTEEAFPRDYLGLSGIGTECYRKLQFDHYWAFTQPISKRILRIFATGHRAEEFMTADLERMGYIITDDQKEIVTPNGYWKGHIDGIVRKDGMTPGLLEMKTHNAKSFKEVDARGVYRAKRNHYAQMQAYMNYLHLSWGLYMAYNKNDSTYYLEKIEFDQEYAKELEHKEIEVIVSDTLLPRIGTGKPTWFQCKFCPASDVCYGSEKPNRSCRTCANVDIAGSGKWECGLSGGELNTPDQVDNCDKYELAEMFK